MQAIDTTKLTTALRSLDVDQSIIDKVVAVLTQTSDDLGDGGFATQAQIPPIALGQRPTAHQLGVHHSKAHEVMQITIDGLATDLLDFASGAQQAAGYIHSADDLSGADLAAVRQAVEDMNAAAQAPSSTNAYDQGRNAPVAPGAPAAPTTTPTEG
jgi:hypothetical protein